MLSNILVAFDGSKHSINAAKFAAKVVELIPGSKCTLITVLTFTKDQALFLGASAEDFEKAEKSFEGSLLENIKKHFGNTPLTIVTREGYPPSEIIKYAGENDIDHIIVGSRGLGNMKGTLLGSVSSKILHNAKCPITIIKD